MEDENSWFAITPTLEHRKRPAVFGPKDVTRRYPEELLVEQEMLESTREHNYLNSGTIPLSALLREKLLQKFPRELIVPNTAIQGPEQNSYYAPRKDFYVDNMVSPSYFKNQFMDTFGSVAYVLEFFGIYFSCFLFVKFIVDLLVMILRHMETTRLTGASLGFRKTLLSASYNLFLKCILTSVFNPQAPLLQALEPEPTPARIEDETRDPADENKKEEEHLYPIVHCSNTALSPV